MTEPMSSSWPTLLLPAAVASEVAGCSAGLESLDSISSIAITLSGGLTSSVQLQLLSVDGRCSVITGDSALVSVLFLAVGERIEGCEHTGDSGDSSSVLLTGVSILDMWKYFNSVGVSDYGLGFHYSVTVNGRYCRTERFLLRKISESDHSQLSLIFQWHNVWATHIRGN